MKGLYGYCNLRCLYHEGKEREVVRIGWKERAEALPDSDLLGHETECSTSNFILNDTT